MNAGAVALSVVSFVWVMVMVVAYFRTIPQGKVPVSVTGLAIKMLLGIGGALAAVGWAYARGSLGALVIVPAVLAIIVATMILWLLSLRKTPIGEIKVEVGDELLAFEAMTSEGVSFHSDELAGKRVMLKFFRGGW